MRIKDYFVRLFQYFYYKKVKNPFSFELSKIETLNQLVVPPWNIDPKLFIYAHDIKIPRDATDHKKRAYVVTAWEKYADSCLANSFLNKEFCEQQLREFCKIDKIQDGGYFSDFFILRQEGDTPICIATRFGSFLLAYLNLGVKIEGFRCLWVKLTNYIENYYPIQYNNHYSWKTFFLLVSSIYLQDKRLFNKSVRMYYTALENQFDKNYDQPMELARGEKGIFYSCMNLEALILIEKVLFGSMFSGRQNSQKIEKGLKRLEERMTSAEREYFSWLWGNGKFWKNESSHQMFNRRVSER